MNWRRGLLLAGMNLLAAVPMICLLAARDAQYMKEREQRSASEGAPWIDSSGESSSVPADIVQAQDEQTVSFSPCGMWVHYPAQTYVVQFGNLPAFVLTQWQIVCPAKWSIAARLGVDASGWISEANFKAMRRVDVVLCVLIVIQWLLIGGFPLIQSRRWWHEPGAFITACTAIASVIALIPTVDGLAKLPAIIAFYGWLWWFGLLLWIPVRMAWRSTLGGLRRLSS